MLELPRILPNRVDDKSALSYGLSTFRSNAGIATTITSVRRGHGFTMTLGFEGLFPSQYGEYLDFLDAIRYDSAAGESALKFRVPRDHLLWQQRVPEHEYIEPQLTTQDIDTALWRMVGYSGATSPLVSFYNFGFKLRNEFG
jgi:hypothetical protein